MSRPPYSLPFVPPHKASTLVERGVSPFFNESSRLNMDSLLIVHHRPGQTGPPPPYSTEGPVSRYTDETEPLLRRRDDQNKQCSQGERGFSNKWFLLGYACAILFVLFLAVPTITIMAAKRVCPEAQQMERERARWALEKRRHEVAEEERKEVYQLWRVEDTAHEAKVRLWGEEDLERVEIRKEWRQEIAKHERFVREREQREAQAHLEVRRKWEREIDEYEREKRERREKEFEERQKMGFFWADVEASHCVRHETRKYTARLANVPDGFKQPVEACKETELSINGEMKRPARCEDWTGLGVYGVWEEEGNAVCGTSFSWFKDKGCTAPNSGFRRYEMYMDNLRAGDDWEAMCSSTPAYFLDKYFAHPDSCSQLNGGTYGFWNVRDTSCL